MTNPTITLGDVNFEIPRLAIKQNRHIEPLITKHSDYFSGIAKSGGNVKLLALTEEQAADFVRIVYYAVTRARPELTLAQFEDMEFSMRDIMLALPVCIGQTGLYKPAAEATPQMGEAGKPSTGTASSPSSATA